MGPPQRLPLSISKDPISKEVLFKVSFFGDATQLIIMSHDLWRVGKLPIPRAQPRVGPLVAFMLEACEFIAPTFHPCPQKHLCSILLSF